MIFTTKLLTLSLIAALSLISTTYAEKPWPPQIDEPTFTVTNTTALPKGLQETISHYDEFTRGKNKIPDTLGVCRIRLKRGGPADYIVASNEGYSGGPMLYVFAPKAGKFVEIDGMQGVVYFGPYYNGYLQIVSRARGGGTGFERSLNRYNNGKYHTVRYTLYRLTRNGVKIEKQTHSD